MKIRKWLSRLLVLCLMMTLFAACASTEEPENDPTDAAEPDGGEGTGNEEDGEIVTIEWWRTSPTNATEESLDAVDAAINEITEKEIGVHVNTTYIAMADYGTQLTLGVSNKEQIDLAVFQFFGNTSFSAYYANGLMMDITEYVEEHAKDAKALLDSKGLLPATSVDGKIYGLSNWRVLNSDVYYIARIDLLEQAGVLDAAYDMDSWDDFEAVSQAVYENTGTYGFTSYKGSILSDPGAILGDGDFADAYAYDTLGDPYYMVYSDSDGHVSLLWEQEDWLNQCKMVKGWMDAGWMWPDSPYDANTGAETVIASGAAAACMAQSEIGVESQKSNSFQTPAMAVDIVPGLITSYTTKKLGTFVPVSAKEPAAAVKFINLMYTNADLMNLIAWGVEDLNYVVNEEGEAAYPEGKDSSSCGYHSSDYSYGNQFLVLPWDGQGADFRDRAFENFDNAPISPYMGVTVDTGSEAALVTAISAVYDEYNNILSSGLYTDDLYNEMLQKLDAAGIDEYLGLFAAEVAEFMA